MFQVMSRYLRASFRRFRSGQIFYMYISSFCRNLSNLHVHAYDFTSTCSCHVAQDAPPDLSVDGNVRQQGKCSLSTVDDGILHDLE